MNRQLEIRSEGDVLILILQARELRTEEDCAALRQEFMDAIRQSGAKKVVVDFSQVAYLTSAAYRPLLALRRMSHQAGARLVLCNLSEDVATVFYVSRLIARDRPDESPFEEQPDVPAAVTYLNRHQGEP
jgi:anti-sigma B factor antagonist